MKPVELDLDIWQGQTFKKSIVWKDASGVPLDLTGFKARMHIRVATKAATVLIELTTENNRIKLNEAPGRIDLVIEAAQSTPIQVPTGVYDLELESPSGEVRRLVQGKITFHPEVTR